MTDSGGICDLQPFATLAFYAFMESDGQVVGFIRSGGIEVDDVIGNFVIDGGFSVYTTNPCRFWSGSSFSDR